MTYGTYQATHCDVALHFGEDRNIYFPFSIPFYTTLAVRCYSLLYLCYLFLFKGHQDRPRPDVVLSVQVPHDLP